MDAGIVLKDDEDDEEADWPPKHGKDAHKRDQISATLADIQTILAKLDDLIGKKSSRKPSRVDAITATMSNCNRVLAGFEDLNAYLLLS